MKFNFFFKNFALSIEKYKVETINSFYEWLENKIDYPKFPILTQIELSNICNLKCAMCNTFSPFIKKCTNFELNGVIDYKYIEKIEPILNNLLYASLFGYGEPLIYPEWEKIVKLMNKYRIFSTFFTNAMMMDETMSRLMVDNHMGKITISFSGSEKEIYENIYIGGNFEKVLKNIKYLVNYRNKNKLKYPKISINSLGFQDHVDSFDKFVEMMGKIGVDEIRIGQLVEFANLLKPLYGQAAVIRPEKEGIILDRAKKIAERYGILIIDDMSNNFLACSEEEYKKMKLQLSCIKESEKKKYKKIDIRNFKKMFKESNPLKDKYEKLILKSFGINDSLIQIKKRLNPINISEDFYCSQPFMTMDILQNGMVKPCCNMSHFKSENVMLGELDKNTLSEIWNGNSFKMFRNLIRNKKYPKNACSQCLSVKSYPPELTFVAVMNDFSSWYRSIYGNSDITESINKISYLLEEKNYKSRILDKK